MFHLLITAEVGWKDAPLRSLPLATTVWKTVAISRRAASASEISLLLNIRTKARLCTHYSRDVAQHGEAFLHKLSHFRTTTSSQIEICQNAQFLWVSILVGVEWQGMTGTKELPFMTTMPTQKEELRVFLDHLTISEPYFQGQSFWANGFYVQTSLKDKLAEQNLSRPHECKKCEQGLFQRPSDYLQSSKQWVLPRPHQAVLPEVGRVKVCRWMFQHHPRFLYVRNGAGALTTFQSEAPTCKTITQVWGKNTNDYRDHYLLGDWPSAI